MDLNDRFVSFIFSNTNNRFHKINVQNVVCFALLVLNVLAYETTEDNIKDEDYHQQQQHDKWSKNETNTSTGVGTAFSPLSSIIIVEESTPTPSSSYHSYNSNEVGNYDTGSNTVNLLLANNIRSTSTAKPTASIAIGFGNRNQYQYGLCPCPCADEDTVYAPICAQTTKGQFRTFNSQCHLICYNQCQITSERYGLVFHHSCPTFLLLQRNSNRYNAVEDDTRRQTDSSSLDGLISQSSWICDCAHCPQTKWYRFDYYPICAEKSGQKYNFDSWCHFDCENKCIRHTGYTYLYLHRGYCVPDMHDIVFSDKSDTTVTKEVDNCELCIAQCKGLYYPVCAKGPLGEYLSFKSRCHLRCHNQCYFQNRNAYFVQVHDDNCRWT